jgi:tungstate transport system substrate-binding protein
VLSVLVRAFISLLLALPAPAQERTLLLASTTSTEQSGLFAHLLPRFQATSGIAVRVVAVGTGQALQLGRRGDADALLLHDRAGEEAFVAAGFGLDRRDVMYNDFVLVGPQADPAGIAGLMNAVTALRRIAGAGAAFASRGDDSGTHRMELRLWQETGLAPRPGEHAWYRELGAGMGATLNTAAAMDAYTLADRGTWLAFRNRRDLALLVAGDRRLFNPYSSILVNPARVPHVKAAEARSWHLWLTGPQGQQSIAEFRVGGEPLFFPAAPVPRS